MAKVNTVAPYDRPQDANVLMTVLHPQPMQGLGNILLLNFTGSGNSQDAGKSDTGKSQDTGAQDKDQRHHLHKSLLYQTT